MAEKLEPAEVFHEVLEHRWFLSQAAGQEVSMERATQSYLDNVLRYRPDEKAFLDSSLMGVGCAGRRRHRGRLSASQPQAHPQTLPSTDSRKTRSSADTRERSEPPWPDVPGAHTRVGMDASRVATRFVLMAPSVIGHG